MLYHYKKKLAASIDRSILIANNRIKSINLKTQLCFFLITRIAVDNAFRFDCTKYRPQTVFMSGLSLSFYMTIIVSPLVVIVENLNPTQLVVNHRIPLYYYNGLNPIHLHQSNGHTITGINHTMKVMKASPLSTF